MGKYTKWVTGGILLYGGVAGATFIYMRPKGCGEAGVASCGNGTSYDGLADRYDSLIGFDEALMGINLLRRWYINRYTKGDVLEVSAGTGRNLRYYPFKSIGSLTLTDLSKEMLWHAKEKFIKMTEHRPALPADAVLFKRADAQHLTRDSNDAHGSSAPPPPFLPASFDTVIDTFGLCSISNPVQALQEMVRVLRPGGTLLLIEHGRSSYSWLNQWLDLDADEHYKRWGCRWNLDILDLCREAGIHVDYVSRWHFGAHPSCDEMREWLVDHKETETDNEKDV